MGLISWIKSWFVSKPNNNAGYGWRPDLPDHRDYKFEVSQEVLKALPPSVDLTKGLPECYDQGALGSCTANAIAAAIQFDQIKQKLPVVMPSRLFIYYNERVVEGTVNVDSGAEIRTGIKVINRQGTCSEKTWPYIIKRFRVRPSAVAYAEGLQHRALRYQRVVRDLSRMKGVLASGFPFVFGFSVYGSFESDQVAETGVVNMPTRNEQVLGGHAVLCVGYDDTTQRFIVRNSWGTNWGVKGYFTMPYAYLLDSDLADDFWVVQQVS